MDFEKNIGIKMNESVHMGLTRLAVLFCVSTMALVACSDATDTADLAGAGQNGVESEGKADIFGSTWTLRQAILDCEAVRRSDLAGLAVDSDESERIASLKAYQECLASANDETSIWVQRYHSEGVREVYAEYRVTHHNTCRLMIRGGAYRESDMVRYRIHECYAQVEEDLSKLIRRFVKLPNERRTRLSLESFREDYEACFEYAAGQHLSALKRCIREETSQHFESLAQGLVEGDVDAQLEQTRATVEGAYVGTHDTSDMLCYFFAHTDENLGRHGLGEVRDSCSAIFSIWAHERLLGNLEL